MSKIRFEIVGYSPGCVACRPLDLREQGVGAKNRLVRIGFIALCVSVVAGCRENTASSSDMQQTREHAAIRVSADSVFERALFYKPAEGALGGLLATFAPLIVQEVAPNAGPDAYSRIVTLPRGTTQSSAPTPTVYVEETVALIAGKPHPQTTYVWFYAHAAGDGAGGRIRWRGLRITAGSDGMACVYEVLNPDATTHRIFVTQAVEDSAARQYGAAHAGRRFAVERPLDAQPNVVVPKVLSDGPVPMGPIVFVAVDRLEVPAVICRCMPSQFKDAVDNAYYDARPLVSLRDVPGAQSSLADLLQDSREMLDPAWLESALRLPNGI